MKINHPRHKFKHGVTSLRPGSVLLEAVSAIVLLAVTSLALLKGSMNTLAPRQWALIQNITDAHMTYEVAYAERIAFSELTAAGSPWPVFPAKESSTVILGTLPGGSNVTGTIVRTRQADPINLPPFGGTGTLTTNPAEIQAWQLQTHILYRIGGRDYVKTRTCVRSK